MAVEGGEIGGAELRLPSASAAGSDDEHVVALRFSERVEGTCHTLDLEQNKNIVKGEYDHKTLQVLDFKAFPGRRPSLEAVRSRRLDH